MNLLKLIRDEIISDNMSLSTTLRKARVLSYLLENKEFEKWVLSELNGYSMDDNAIPSYRIISAENTGDFAGFGGSGVTNLPFPTYNLPDYVRKFAAETKIIQGVKSIESLVESDSSMLTVSWPPDYVAACQSKIYVSMNLYCARKVIAKSSIVQILDTVKNKLLDFVLELQKQNPEMESEGDIKLIASTKVASAFEAHISGSYNSSKV